MHSLVPRSPSVETWRKVRRGACGSIGKNEAGHSFIVGKFLVRDWFVALSMGCGDAGSTRADTQARGRGHDVCLRVWPACVRRVDEAKSSSDPEFFCPIGRSSVCSVCRSYLQENVRYPRPTSCCWLRRCLSPSTVRPPPPARPPPTPSSSSSTPPPPDSRRNETTTIATPACTSSAL